MKKTLVFMILVLGISLAGERSGQAEEVGRYQALKITDNSIFILDTKDGHMWLQTLDHAYDANQSSLYLYLGRVEAGKSPLIEYRQKLEQKKKMHEKERVVQERKSQEAIEQELEKIRKRKEAGEVKKLILKQE